MTDQPSSPLATPASATTDTAAAGLPGRITGILLQPRKTWQTIAAEDDSIARIYRSHLFWLLLFSSVCSFIGMSLVGIGAFGMTVRVPILVGLIQLVVGLALALLMAYLLAWLANALAPRFGGQAHLPSAFKLLAYAATAALLGSVFQIVPLLGWLGLFAAIYSVCLFYIGAPVLLKVQRAGLYTLVFMVCAFVATMLVGWVAAWVTPGMPDVLASRTSSQSIRLPTGQKVDMAQMERLTEQLARADQTGSVADQAAAIGSLVATVTGAAIGSPAIKAPQRTDAEAAQKNLQPAQTPQTPVVRDERTPSQDGDTALSGLAKAAAELELSPQTVVVLQSAEQRIKALEQRMEAASTSDNPGAVIGLSQELMQIIQDPAVQAAQQELIDKQLTAMNAQLAAAYGAQAQAQTQTQTTSQQADAATPRAAPASAATRPLDAAQLRVLLPEQLLGLPRTRIQARQHAPGQAPELSLTTLTARYEGHGQRIQVKLQDVGGPVGELQQQAPWIDPSDLTAAGAPGVMVSREFLAADGTATRLVLVLPNRLLLEIEGHEQLHAAAVALDLQALQRIPR